MRYPFRDKKVAGILVPLAALRSGASMGCGEYADLVTLGEWCVGRGIELIQLLPVNDTGGQSSPYSALSANALHPIYIRIQDIPEYQSLSRAERDDIDAAIARGRE